MYTINQNMQMPPSLLSRFDLVWLLRDTPDYDNDHRLADHVSYVHIHCKQPPVNFTPYSPSLLRRYIQLCKRKQPTITKDLHEYIVNAYCELRCKCRESYDATYASPRNLMGVIRMATSLARLRLSDIVEKDDVIEVLRLIEKSKESIIEPDARRQL